MTSHDPTPLSDDALRWQLRALRQDTPPARDLWPDLAARLAATPQQAVAPPRRRVAPFALAGSDKNWAEVMGGLTVSLGTNLDFSVEADTTVFRSDFRNQSYRGRLTIRF